MCLPDGDGVDTSIIEPIFTINSKSAADPRKKELGGNEMFICQLIKVILSCKKGLYLSDF